MKQNSTENFLSAVTGEHESSDYSDNAVNSIDATIELNHLEMKTSIFTKSLALQRRFCLSLATRQCSSVQRHKTRRTRKTSNRRLPVRLCSRLAVRRSRSEKTSPSELERWP